MGVVGTGFGQIAVQTGAGSGPEVLVLYLERPRVESWELRRCVGGASDTAT